MLLICSKSLFLFCLDLTLIPIRYCIVPILIFVSANSPLTVKKLISHLETISCLFWCHLDMLCSFILSENRLLSSNHPGKSCIWMLNKIVASASPCFKPIVIRKVWVISSWYIRDIFGYLYIDWIIWSVFLISPISFNLCNKYFWHTRYTLFESQQSKCVNTFIYL